MQKNKVTSSIFILFILIIFSCGFFAIAQEKNSTQNIFLDSDQDGLSDTEEKTYGTDPLKADTDGDSYSDGVEVKGGYDPLKPAPGDKIVPEEKNSVAATENISTSSTTNLTSKISRQVSTIASSSDPDQQEISLSEVEKMVSDSLAEEPLAPNIAEVKKEDLKIKKQDYKKLSDEKRKEKIKEDGTDYMIGLFYVFSSNSPYPITSSDNLFSMQNPILEEISSAMLTRDSKKLEDLATSGEKMIEQMKAMEVPEDLAEMHLKAIRFAQFSTTLRQYLDPNSKDPIADLVNMSKIQGFLDTFLGFVSEMQTKMSEYNISYDDSVKDKLKDLGIDTTKVLDGALTPAPTTTETPTSSIPEEKN